MMTGSLFEDMAHSTPDKEWFTAHCDGGSRGNPGPSAYGAVIEDAHGREVARLSKFLGKQTNNFAEYSGLLAVLAWAIENGAKRLRVVSDSELMVKQMKGQYKVNNPGLRPLWEEAKKLARRLEGFEISHTLRGGNKKADGLANEAMDRGTGKIREQGTEGRDQRTEIREQGTGNREQGTEIRDQRSERRDQGTGLRPNAGAGPRQVLEGYVKGGVVHLLEGELPDGVFVKVTRE
jgi:probable phosphoglycerate mutase